MCRSLFLAGFVIIAYDYLLTLGSEVQYIWSSKLRRSTCVYLAIRYIGVAASVKISVYYLGDLSREVC
ncbi:hypothetical protein C8R47DRAFT_1158660 [Mycena vitilis]|nr:hypothetical protein C8R47DRAFT_1158660 [Mycena vitilis]